MRLAPGIVASALTWALVSGSAALAAALYPAFYPADAARGKELSASCVACHGPAQMMAGNQGFHVPKLIGQHPSSIFSAMLEYKIGARRSDMMAPMVAALSLQDMRDIAAYLAGPDIKPSPESIPDTWAHRRVHADCAACHGETGLGVMPGYPVLGGQYEDYLVHALNAFKSGERADPTMHVMARRLSNSEMSELAQYFSARGYLRASP